MSNMNLERFVIAYRHLAENANMPRLRKELVSLATREGIRRAEKVKMLLRELEAEIHEMERVIQYREDAAG